MNKNIPTTATAETKKTSTIQEQQQTNSTENKPDYLLIYNEIKQKQQSKRKLLKRERVIQAYVDNPVFNPKEIANQAQVSVTYARTIRNQLKELGWEAIKPKTLPKMKSENLTQIQRAMKDGVEPEIFEESQKKIMTHAIQAISRDTLDRSAEMYEIGQEVYLGYAHIARNLGMTVFEFVDMTVQWFQKFAPAIEQMEDDLRLLTAYRDVTLPMLNAKKAAEEITIELAMMSMLFDQSISMWDMLKFEAMAERLIDHAMVEILRKMPKQPIKEREKYAEYASEPSL